MPGSGLTEGWGLTDSLSPGWTSAPAGRAPSFSPLGVLGANNGRHLPSPSYSPGTSQVENTNTDVCILCNLPRR